MVTKILPPPKKSPGQIDVFTIDFLYTLGMLYSDIILFYIIKLIVESTFEFLLKAYLEFDWHFIEFYVYLGEILFNKLNGLKIK